MAAHGIAEGEEQAAQQHQTEEDSEDGCGAESQFPVLAGAEVVVFIVEEMAHRIRLGS
jgi:hypothetical protein